MNYRKLLLIICFSFISYSNYSQTIGLLHHTTDTTDGYTLFTPEKNNNTYLINNCGEVVNQWTFTERPGLTCYLLENGNLLRAGRDYLETRDWNNNIIWSYNMQAAGYNQHHDIEPLPNGNVLCLLSHFYSDNEMIAEGKNPSFTDANFKIDELIELEPNGLNGATVVWKWSFLDHFIQDFNSTKSNYGIVANHPELIDINYNNLATDIIHLNSIDYNADLDQILLSARHMSELYIIDHSTTTAEAASHTGGTYGKGGDVLWRWGNPETYRQGSSINQKLYSQHDARWVTSGYADENKITVFNNGGIDGSFSNSSIHIITPEIISGEYQIENLKFKPNDFEWSWQGTILGSTVLNGRKSGTHGLPNGNMMVCETGEGRISEIKKDGTLVWSYINPTGQGTTIYTQNESNPSTNTIFRGDKYPATYVGFTGKDLTPTGIIENQNSISENCINFLSVNTKELKNIKVINPISDSYIRFNSEIQLDNLTIYDTNGREIYKQDNFNNSFLDLDIVPGIYLLKLQKGEFSQTTKIIKL